MKDYQLIGTENNDQLTGNIGNDLLDGGLGNDLLLGGKGNDTYIFKRGYGHDLIMDSDSTVGIIDTIIFGEDITNSDLQFKRVGDNLRISIIGTDDYITISNYYYDEKYRIEKIQFYDGTIWDKSTIEKLSGIKKEPIIYNIGFGVIIIEDDEKASEIIDTIRFGQGILPKNIAFTKTGNDLEIGILGISDKIIVKNYYSLEHYKIQEIDFYDESVWNSQFIASYYTYVTGNGTIEGTIGKNNIIGSVNTDQISGLSGADFIDGKGGSDYINGGVGNDTYIFNLGYGTMVIEDYDEATGVIDTIKFGEGIDINSIGFIRSVDNLEITIKGTEDKLVINNFYKSTNYQIEKFILADGIIFDRKAINTLLVYGTPDKDIITVSSKNETIFALASDDTVYGYGGDDLLYGGEGNDILHGGQGDDLLEGGLGNDTLYGEAGQDIYVFRKGDGQDTINDTAGENNTIIDTLRFEDIDSTEVTLNKSAYDLVITVNGSSDSVRILSYFYSNDYKVEKIEFQDGVVLDINAIMKGYVYINGTNSNEQISGYCSGENEFIGNVIINGFDGNDTLNGSAGNDKVYGGNGDDTIVGNNGDDTLEGGAGKDTLRGSAGKDILKGGSEDDTLNGEIGDDILDGEKGNDTLTGGAGSDTYVFRKGDGQDIIVDYSGEANTIIDTLKFEDIAASEVSLNCTGYDLIIAVNDSTDSVRIQNYFTADLYKIENIQFKDGTTWDINTIRNSIVYANGTEEKDSLYAAGPVTMNGYGGDDTLRTENANDKIYGGAGIDTIIAGAGNDSLYGEVGNDILYGRVGDDILEGGLGNDTLYGEAGQDVYVFRKGDGQDIIYNSSSLDTDNDKLSFTDVNLSETTFIKTNTDLIIKLNETTDSATISGYFNYGKYSLEGIEFMNSETLTSEDVNNVIAGKYVSTYNINLEKAVEILSGTPNSSVSNITGTSTSSDITTDILVNMNN
ncbi:calcium-binding protein [Clostridium cellulovorans]|uniref:Hemolysin-type calcium-binding region n=1 Tax=Clostridium cellulovorans (strain ATCC 35296 / DSM 3052 / OCM 3 / 743B) TaxID=573061 RepID=D9SPT9_CLOC7|nr:calcium-binding protein [Clostridium cellulovorans]ADL52075.1 Hemolysin-type calcium-binding region [Clostridium cellulovorans 743B]